MSATEVSKLREETGAGILDCKKALDEAGGDLEKATEILRAKGIAKADKKSDRAIGASHMEAYIHDGRIGVLVQMGAETDFVTRNEDFKAGAHNIAMHIAAMGSETVEELLLQQYMLNPEITVAEYLKSLVGRIGENIQVIRFTRYEA